MRPALDSASREFTTILVGASLLSWTAGFANVLGILSKFSSTVSHQSGNVSRLGVAVAHGDLDTSLFFATVIMSFALGAFFAALVVGDSKFTLGRAYWSAILIESFGFLLAFLLLRADRRAGEYAASFACGVQNSLTSNYAGAVVRTTHLTGTITDIFSILGVYAAKGARNPDLWKLHFYVPSTLFFLFGAGCATFAFRSMGVYAYLVPTAITFSLAMIYVSSPTIREARRALKSVRGRVRHLTLHLHDEHGFPVVPTNPSARETAILDADIANLLSDLERYLSRDATTTGRTEVATSIVADETNLSLPSSRHGLGSSRNSISSLHSTNNIQRTVRPDLLNEVVSGDELTPFLPVLNNNNVFPASIQRQQLQVSPASSPDVPGTHNVVTFAPDKRSPKQQGSSSTAAFVRRRSNTSASILPQLRMDGSLLPRSKSYTQEDGLGSDATETTNLLRSAHSTESPTSAAAQSTASILSIVSGLAAFNRSRSESGPLNNNNTQKTPIRDITVRPDGSLQIVLQTDPDESDE